MDVLQEADNADMSTSTPSPPADGSTAGTPAASASNSASASRRPPRKSTLTQQQKNQKRQRATQDQLVTLELEFSKNPTPTATVRERIAQDINMTERSVQIWFQNRFVSLCDWFGRSFFHWLTTSRRRAKIKLIHKKSIETGEDIDQIPDSMRQYLFHQAQESGKPFPSHLLGRTGGAMAAYGGGTMLMNADPANSGKVGMSQSTIDLIVECARWLV
jgi:hypothetical protein